MAAYRGERGIARANRGNLAATEFLYERGFLADPIVEEDEPLTNADGSVTEPHQEGRE